MSIRIARLPREPIGVALPVRRRISIISISLTLLPFAIHKVVSESIRRVRQSLDLQR
jgi:hypothetical protein